MVTAYYACGKGREMQYKASFAALLQNRSVTFLN
jgi:hypothetical protein